MEKLRAALHKAEAEAREANNAASESSSRLQHAERVFEKQVAAAPAHTTARDTQTCSAMRAEHVGAIAAFRSVCVARQLR